jgi:uncharacterized LabA/DUF88 family protein
MIKRVAVFVDIGNQFFCINKKWPGRKLDYAKFLKKAETFGPVVRAFAFGTQVSNSAAKFIERLEFMGYEVQYKELNKHTWYCWDVGLAINTIRMHEKVDTIIIGSSNRTLVPIVKFLQEKGIRVVIAASGIGTDLRNACDRYIELSEAMLEPKIVQIQEEEKTILEN